MRTHVLLAAVVATLLGTGPAAATPKVPLPKGCAIADPVDDVRSAAFDIACANVVIGKKTIVGVLRVLSLEDEPLYESAAGASWTLSFSVDKARYTFARERPAGAGQAYHYTFEGIPVRAHTTRNEIRWTVPRSSAPAAKAAGARATAHHATAAGLLSKDSAGSAPKKR